MKIRKQFTFYILLLVLMLLDIYSIFNAGNPNSILRYIVPDPGWDYLITIIISLSIFAIVIIMNRTNKKVDDPVYLALVDNKIFIQKLREKGKSDEEIAFSFTDKLNENSIVKKIAYRKAVKYLKRI